MINALFLYYLKHSNGYPLRVILDVGITRTRPFEYICHVKKLFTMFKNGKFIRPTDLWSISNKKSCS